MVHKGNAKVHVSGHAPARPGELGLLAQAIVQAPAIRCREVNGCTLRGTGTSHSARVVDPDRVVIAEDGVVVDLVDGRASVRAGFPQANV
nr:hypothetical protein [Streptomyces sp. DHE17-7]